MMPNSSEAARQHEIPFEPSPEAAAGSPEGALDAEHLIPATWIEWFVIAQTAIPSRRSYIPRQTGKRHQAALVTDWLSGRTGIGRRTRGAPRSRKSKAAAAMAAPKIETAASTTSARGSKGPPGGSG